MLPVPVKSFWVMPALASAVSQRRARILTGLCILPTLVCRCVRAKSSTSWGVCSFCSTVESCVKLRGYTGEARRPPLSDCLLGMILPLNLVPAFPFCRIDKTRLGGPVACVLRSNLYTTRSFRNRQRVGFQSSNGPDICDVHLFGRRTMLTGRSVCRTQRIGR